MRDQRTGERSARGRLGSKDGPRRAPPSWRAQSCCSRRRFRCCSASPNRCGTAGCPRLDVALAARLPVLDSTERLPGRAEVVVGDMLRRSRNDTPSQPEGSATRTDRPCPVSRSSRHRPARRAVPLPEPFHGQRVVVVGAGDSAVPIAAELAEHAHVISPLVSPSSSPLSVRSAVTCTSDSTAPASATSRSGPGSLTASPPRSWTPAVTAARTRRHDHPGHGVAALVCRT